MNLSPFCCRPLNADERWVMRRRITAPHASSCDPKRLPVDGGTQCFTMAAFSCPELSFHVCRSLPAAALHKLVTVWCLVQDAGVLVSRKAHGAHHRAPFEGNYCIVSGIWNPILDQVRRAC